MLNASELFRYSRHLILPGFGAEAQEKLKAAKILVVGAGGLGSPLLQYLAAAGVGTIGIIDADRVDESNLQRQVLYTVNDIGRPKTAAAAEKLSALNPNIHIKPYPLKLDSSNALELFSEYDLVADGSDNFPTRYLVNDAAVLSGKPYVYGSVFRFEGQVALFNALLPDGSRSANYRDLYPDPPGPGAVPSCEEGGVLGILPGTIGTLMATEIIKWITSTGVLLAGKYLLYDALDLSFRTLSINKLASNPLSGDQPAIQALIDYDAFCGVPPTGIVREITVDELRALQRTNEVFQLIDVREPEEYAEVNMNGLLIPLSQVAARHSEIGRSGKVVIHCRSGKRSEQAIRELQDTFHYTNLYNLKGGILAYLNG